MSPNIVVKSVLASVVAVSALLPATSTAGPIDVFAQAGPTPFETTLQWRTSKNRTIDKLELDLDEAEDFNRIFLGGLDLFGVDHYATIRWRGLKDSDPWLFFVADVFNHGPDSELFYGFDARLPTDVTSGPTVKDAFLEIALADANADGLARSRNTTASFTVIDDPGGQNINHQDALGFIPPFSDDPDGAGLHTLIDATGTGPNSDLVASTDGYNILRFLMNGSLSPGDSVRITGFACYAASADLCPTRESIRILAGREPVAAVAEPAPVLMLFSGLAALAGVAGLRRIRGRSDVRLQCCCWGVRPV